MTGTFPVSSESPLEFYLRDRPDSWGAVIHEADLEARLAKLAPATRVHFVYRDATYAARRLQRFCAALELVDSTPPLRRVSYMLFVKT